MARSIFPTKAFIQEKARFVEIFFQHVVLKMVAVFVWVEVLRPSQQFFSHVGTEPPLPGYYQYFLGGKCILLDDTTR